MSELDWFEALALVGVVEATAALSFLPAFRHDWRRWRGIDWWAEFPLAYPPLFYSGPLWFVLQLVNALGAFFVLRTNNPDDVAHYHVSLAFWAASLVLWALWGIPWEYESVFWPMLDWLIAAGLSSVAAIAAYKVDETALPGAILLTVYTGILGAIALFNLLLIGFRWVSRPAGLVLHTRFTNPFAGYLRNLTWHPLYDVDTEKRTHRSGE